MNTTIQITEAAATYIKKMVEKEAGIGLRLSIKKTGCSGYSYSPAVIKESYAQDKIIESIAQVKIFIDSAWLDLFQGVIVDYVEEDKLGLKQKKLVFINPNEASRCGCGESFHVATESDIK
ncbi:MAG TPA: iron-sulfur cluster assembly accessory protein [Gammaproteobacteria bacterium]|jgi:iron-sulfur cluster assembly protein|nr:iron-sulfur cluster assembly accessory protein [Gammaproteobacteria bacterium]